MTTYSATVNTYNTSSSHRTVTQNVGTGDTINVSFSNYSPVTTLLVSLITNCSSSVSVNGHAQSGLTLTFSGSSAGTYDLRVTHFYSSGKTSTTKYSGVTGTVSAATPTLTAVDISPATATISNGGTQAFTASITGNVTDTVYAWSLSGDTDNVSLSSSSGNPVTVTATDNDDTSQETVTVNVSATSSQASVSSGVTAVSYTHLTLPTKRIV